MHRFRSQSVIIRFRFASLLLCLKYIFPSVAVALLLASILTREDHLTDIAISLGGLTLLCMAVQCILARKALCPLCMTPVLANKLCSKHRNSRKLFGSHRLRVAVSVLAKGSFTCPYCHEASEMKARHRRR